jgi:hypothetical protein
MPLPFATRRNLKYFSHSRSQFAPQSTQLIASGLRRLHSLIGRGVSGGARGGPCNARTSAGPPAKNARLGLALERN